MEHRVGRERVKARKARKARKVIIASIISVGAAFPARLASESVAGWQPR